MKSRTWLAAACLLLLPVAGCGSQPVREFPDGPYTNACDPFLYDAGDYLVSTIRKGGPEFCLKGEDQFQPVERDPFSGETAPQRGDIRPYGNGFFYKCETQTGTQIRYLDLDSFQEHTVYEQTVSRSVSLFGVELWSAPNISGALARQSRIVDYCFLENRLILIHGGYVSVVDRGRETVLFDKEIEQVACFGGSLYVTDAFGNVFRAEPATGDSTRLEGVKAYSLAVDEGGLVFTNRLDGGKLYRMPVTGGEAIPIGDMVPETFAVYRKDIWITAGGRLYYASAENGRLREILADGAEKISILDQGATIYTARYENGGFVMTHRVERRAVVEG